MGFSGNKGGKAEMSESCYIQRERTWKRMSRALGKTTVIEGKQTYLIYPNQKKKEEGEEGEEEKKEVKERGDQGNGESRGRKKRVSKC